MRAKKGSAFERHVCKQLSRWWSNGKRDDIFWRSSQSGGRATQRAKKGQRTFGSYGDVAAVDPCGQPLLNVFTIELKRGNSHGTPADLLDFKQDNSRHTWVKCLKQAIKSHLQAGSKSWLLIMRRDKREAVVYLETAMLKRLMEKPAWGMNTIRFALVIDGEWEAFTAMKLDDFLDQVWPEDLRHT